MDKKPTIKPPKPMPRMVKTSAPIKRRNQIAEKNFALPGRRYPIHDASHARNALSRVAQHGTPEEKARVRSAVASRYPGIGKQASIEYRGRTFPGYNKPIASDRADKKKMVLAKKGDQVKLIHFGQKGYKHNYSEAAKKNYLARSAGIRGKGGLTKNDKFSANYWARRVLWPSGPADGSTKTASIKAIHKLIKKPKKLLNRKNFDSAMFAIGAGSGLGALHLTNKQMKKKKLASALREILHD